MKKPIKKGKAKKASPKPEQSLAVRKVGMVGESPIKPRELVGFTDLEIKQIASALCISMAVNNGDVDKVMGFIGIAKMFASPASTASLEALHSEFHAITDEMIKKQGIDIDVILQKTLRNDS